MKTAIISAIFALEASATPARRQTTTSWAGTNNYFIQGTTPEVQSEFIGKLVEEGIKVMRLWVSSQPGNRACLKGMTSVSEVPHFETTIGEYNWKTLDLLDFTLTLLEERNIKAIISPHDANLLNGSNGNDVYGQTYGSNSFYEEQEARDAFDNRISAILNYRGVHSNRVWKDWHETIMSFNLQNEPFAPEPEQCQRSSAAEWIRGRSSHIREVLGRNNPVKVSSGGFGGDNSHGCTFVGVDCEQLDMISVHKHAGGQDDNDGQWSSAYQDWIEQANGKHVFLEEWAVNKTQYDVVEEFPKNTDDMNNAGLPWLYSQFKPYAKCDIGEFDTFGFNLDDSVPWKEALLAADWAECPQDWSKIVYER